MVRGTRAAAALSQESLQSFRLSQVGIKAFHMLAMQCEIMRNDTNTFLFTAMRFAVRNPRLLIRNRFIRKQSKRDRLKEKAEVDKNIFHVASLECLTTHYAKRSLQSQVVGLSYQLFFARNRNWLRE